MVCGRDGLLVLFPLSETSHTTLRGPSGVDNSLRAPVVPQKESPVSPGLQIG